MIAYINGNILASDRPALVNPVNCVGVMGKGLAASVKRCFPHNYKAYREACERGEVQVGKLFIYKHGIGHMRPRWIVNFPTKNHWKDPSQIVWIRDGLIELRKFIEEEKVTGVAIPALGCGLGGLRWMEVRPLIERVLEGVDSSICIYEP